MNLWHAVRKERITPTEFLCCVEISADSSLKYELDKETGALRLDRILSTATHYPHNYGFIPRTLGDDGDPLDVLLIASRPIQPLALARAIPLGVVMMEDTGRGDEKILAVSNPITYSRTAASLPADTAQGPGAYSSMGSRKRAGKSRGIQWRFIPSPVDSMSAAAKIKQAFSGKPACFFYTCPELAPLALFQAGTGSALRRTAEIPAAGPRG